MLRRNEQDAAVRKAATATMAKNTLASNKTDKNVIEAKQGNDGRQNVLTDTKDKIVRREAIGIRDVVNPGKETTGMFWETQEIKGRPKGDDNFRAEIEKEDKEYKELLA